MAKQSNVAVTAKTSFKDRLLAEIGPGRAEFYTNEIASRLGCSARQVADSLSKMELDGEIHVSRKPTANYHLRITVRPIHVVSRLWRLALGVNRP